MEKKREMFAGENGLQGDPRLKAISEAIRVVPHFPKPGPSCFLFFWLKFPVFLSRVLLVRMTFVVFLQFF